MPLVCFVVRINEKGSSRGDWGSKNWEGAKMGGSKWTNVHLICILQSGIMLKGQEKQQQVIKNSKKCFVFFITYMMFCLLQWFTVWFLLRSRYLFDVCYYFFYIPNQKKELLLFYICSRGLFTYLDNNIGINRKITRNCLFATYTVCLLLFVC